MCSTTDSDQIASYSGSLTCGTGSPRSGRGVIAEIALPGGAELLQGKRREELGQLEGKAYKHTGVSFWPDHNVTDDRAKIEWMVRGRAGDEVKLTARHERAGTVRTTVKLV